MQSNNKFCPHCKTEINARATKCPQCQSDLRSWSSRHKIITAVLIIIGTFVALRMIIGMFNGPSGTALNTTTQSINQTPLVLDTTGSVPYEIVKKEDNSVKALTGNLSDHTSQELQAAPLKKRFVYRIVVAPNVTNEQAKATINKVIADESTQDPDIDEISVLVYGNKKDVSGSYTIAMGDWAPQGKWGTTTPAIASSNDRRSYQVTYQYAR